MRIVLNMLVWESVMNKIDFKTKTRAKQEYRPSLYHRKSTLGSDYVFLGLEHVKNIL